jgi:DNA-binding LacI/PurR family transcriptional regulator
MRGRRQPEKSPLEGGKNGRGAGARGARRSVGIRELAAHLDLSPTTVSRVLNHSGGVFRIAEKTQERVIRAAAMLNYEPNAFARGLRKRRSFTIGVMVPEISEGYSAQVLGGIEDALLQEEFFYFVVSHRHRADLLEGYPRLLLSRAVEGIIAVDTPIDQDVPVPVVAVSGHTRRHHEVTIELDHLSAARFALEHLRDLGHRRIAFIKGQSFSSDTRARWNAIRKVSSALRLRIHPELVVQLEGTAPGSEPGYAATRRLLSTGHRFSAIFAFNDASAMGAMTALHEAGFHVPRDVSVVGFDDIPSAATMHPSLTTVRQPLREMGQSAAATLLRLIRNAPERPDRHSILVSPTFVRRHSTAKVAAP